MPPNRRVVEPSACSNGSKIVSSFSAGMPIPVSATAKRRMTLLARRVSSRPTDDDDLAALGELDGVADQVDQDLAQPAGVADQSVGNVGGDPAGQLQALGSGPQRQGLERFLAARRAGETAIGSRLSLPASILEKSRMSLITVEQRIGRALDQAEVLALPWRQLGIQGQLGHADDAVHRRADLVAHVGEKLALGSAGRLGGLLGDPQLLLGALDLGDVGAQTHDAAVAGGKVANPDPSTRELLFVDALPAAMSGETLRNPLVLTRCRLTKAAVAMELAQDFLVLAPSLGSRFGALRVDLAIALVADDEPFLGVIHHQA